MSRFPAIEHYLERAMDRAALIAALAMARTDETSSIDRLAERQDAQLHDFIHEFAFDGRKLIELLKRENLPCAEIGFRPSVACAVEDVTEEYPVASKSLQHIFGRIIHSDRFSIDRTVVPAADDGPGHSGESPWAFSVASDRDDGVALFVYLQFFLEEFLVLEEAVRRDLYRSLRLEK